MQDTCQQCCVSICFVKPKIGKANLGLFCFENDNMHPASQQYSDDVQIQVESCLPNLEQANLQSLYGFLVSKLLAP